MATPNRFVRPLTGQQKIAVERMFRLDELAAEEVNTNPARSKRYVELIQGLSTRFRVAIPDEVRNHFCKGCGNYWVYGENVSIRVKGKTKNFVCHICGKLTRRKMISNLAISPLT
ncbi:MAG: ribonuclease P [Candidatus Diapherotrites archaeon]|nr:ribonuclease P [Candidatus Diapherotrites archaeon]MDZ4256174.1 ribonuclease P [archaeon]